MSCIIYSSNVMQCENIVNISYYNGGHMKTELFETIGNKTIYKVPTQNKPISGTVTVPGSKSITNRALLIAALSEGKSTLSGVLFSDDSRHFLSALISLGFDVDINEEEKKSLLSLDKVATFLINLQPSMLEVLVLPLDSLQQC